MQRMRELPVHGARRCDERLRRHLSTEDATRTGCLVAAAEDVEVDVLEIEEIEQIVERIVHARDYSSEVIWPSRTSSRNGRLRASPSAPIDVTPDTPG